MIYLIGGPARCGKTTTARQMRQFIHGQVIAGDTVVHALQAILSPEWMPDIYDHAIAGVQEMSDVHAMINRLRRRDDAMWQFYTAFCDASVLDAPKEDILLEGSIWPDFLDGFSHAHRAVFLVDTSENGQYKRLLEIRDSKDSDNNWMHSYDDERIRDWVRFNRARSQRYVEYCNRYGYAYFDIADHGIEIAERKALAYLRAPVV